MGMARAESDGVDDGESHGYTGWMIAKDDGDSLLLRSPVGQVRRVWFGDIKREDDGMSDRDDAERRRKAIADLHVAAEAVVERHDAGTLSSVKGDSMAIEALRMAVIEAHFAKVREEER